MCMRICLDVDVHVDVHVHVHVYLYVYVWACENMYVSDMYTAELSMSTSM